MKTLLHAATALIVAVPIAGSAFAQDRVVADYRNKQFRAAEPSVGPTEKARLSSALASAPAAKDLAKDFVLLGQAKGKLGKEGDVDFFLVSAKAPAASQPFPDGASQVVVAMKGKDAVATYVVPNKRQYARLVAAVDVDGDSNSEILLEGSGYNMGQLVMSLDAMKLGTNGTMQTQQSIAEVYADSCENPVGQKTRSAKTITLKGGKLEAAAHPEKCG